MNLLTKSVILVFLTLMIKIMSQTTYPHKCTESDKNKRFCTKEYIPVCGWFNSSVKCNSNPCAVNSNNLCLACLTKGVQYVTLGRCPKKTPKLQFLN